jgi:hypothetical protein
VGNHRDFVAFFEAIGVDIGHLVRQLLSGQAHFVDAGGGVEGKAVHGVGLSVNAIKRGFE